MARRDGEPRIWPYALLFVLLCAGAIWGRKVEVSQRNSAQEAANSVSIQYEEQLATTLAETRACRADGRCDGPGAGFFGIGSEDDKDADVEGWMRQMNDLFWPEFGTYLDGTLRWNATVRAALDENLSVEDPAALAQLLDGDEPGRLAADLADARVRLAEREDRGRLLSRVFGWGWKICLAALIVSPVTAGYFKNRWHQERLYARWRAAQDRKTPPPVIPVGSERT